MVQLSRSNLIIAVQSVVIVFLASWLYIEYVHNRFMQEYLANLWASNYRTIPLALLASGLIAGGSYVVFAKRSETISKQGLSVSRVRQELDSTDRLSSLDICPFCSIPLKRISENRFHCRKCRRYFKA